MKLFVNNLTVIDSSYLCPDRGIVGESWIVDVELGGKLNEMDMLLDFGRVKKLIKALIDEYVDHKLLLPARHPALQLRQNAEQTEVHFTSSAGKQLLLKCPEQAFALIDVEELTNSGLESHLVRVLSEHLPNNIEGLVIGLRHERIDGPYYHYSHGLKKHDGNCQRIAHGHRSTIEVFVDGEHDESLSNSWAMRWRNIYLGSELDLVEPSVLSLAIPDQLAKRSHCFAYRSQQGAFEMVIEQGEVELIPYETTVENLARYIAETLAQSMPGHQLKVVAYEGVGKGAIAEARA